MLPISICVIMKNEEKNVENFLSAIEKHFNLYPHETILVDTGSTDKTLELASKYPTKIYHFDWINDFSAARNYSLSLASNDYVLILDVDEFIESLDTTFFDSFINQFPTSVGMLRIKNRIESEHETSNYEDDVPRFFSKKLFMYDGIIHEQIVSRTHSNFARVKIPLCVNHVGYSGTLEDIKKKSKRNIDLLKEHLKKGDDPYIYFQIGQSYYAMKDYKNASDYFSKALEFDLDPRLAYVRQMVVSYGYSLLECERINDALNFENIYDAFADYPEFVLLMGSIYLKAGILENAIDEFSKATTFKTANTSGVNTYIPLYNLGCIAEVLGNIDDAIELYGKCGDYPPALSRINELK